MPVFFGCHLVTAHGLLQLCTFENRFPHLDQEHGQYIESYSTDKNITTKLNESYKVLLHHLEKYCPLNHSFI